MDRTIQPHLAYLDTHVVVWLYSGLVDKLSRKAARTIETSLLRASPLVELELQYLYEIGRLKPNAEEVLSTLLEEIGLLSSDPPLQALARQAVNLNWTRDPFDRLITAEALLARAPLVTKDEMIRKHYAQAIW